MGADNQSGETLLVSSQRCPQPASANIGGLQEVLTSAVESGISTFLFATQHEHLAGEWQGVVQFEALHCQGDMIIGDGSQVLSQNR